MQEPTYRFLLSCYLDHAAAVPVGVAELAQLVDPIDDLLQDLSVPTTRLPFASHAVAGVPLPAVHLPGHFDLAADVRDIQVIRSFGHVLRGIERRAMLVGTGLQHGGKRLAGIRAFLSFAIGTRPVFGP